MSTVVTILTKVNKVKVSLYYVHMLILNKKLHEGFKDIWLTSKHQQIQTS